MSVEVDKSLTRDSENRSPEIGDEMLIQVRFRTKQSRFTVTESIITVPARLRRYGFSEIINHLLGNSKHIPFDFLIGGEFLRTSLAHFMETRAISTV
jgi:ribosome biogenesis protein